MSITKNCYGIFFVFKNIYIFSINTVRYFTQYGISKYCNDRRSRILDRILWRKIFDLFYNNKNIKNHQNYIIKKLSNYRKNERDQVLISHFRIEQYSYFKLQVLFFLKLYPLLHQYYQFHYKYL